MTVTVQQVLDTYADGMSETEFAEALEAGLAARSAERVVDLTESEREVLVAAGAEPNDLDQKPGATIRFAQDAADALIDAVAASLSVSEAADALGIDPSRVRHRICDRSLAAVKLGTRLRLPRWQFGDSGAGHLEPLPHLRRILASTPPPVTSVEIAAFMTSVQADLRLGDSAVTPRGWLLAGGSPGPICEMLANFYQW